MDDQLKLAFDHARGLAELIITLSTGVIGVTITFMKELEKDDRIAVFGIWVAAER